MTAIRRHLAATLPLLLAAAGLAVAIVLLREHLMVNEGGVAGGLFCGGGGGFDCSLVAAHESSWLFALPLALWGVFFYVVMTALGLTALLPGGTMATRVALALAVGAVAFDAWLAWIMVARIGTVCLNCAATYLINALLVVALWWRLRRPAAAVPAVHAPGTGGGALSVGLKAAIAGAALAGGVFAFVYTRDEVTLVQELADAEAQEFLAQLDQPAAFDMARFAGRPTRGPADAKLQIAVASDFQCAYCRSIATNLERLMDEHPGQIRVIYVNAPVSRRCNPLIKSDRHKYACWLARTANCAAAQGKFWEYHDLIYSTMPQILVDSAHVEPRLAGLGLDLERVRSCMDSGEAQAALEQDLAILAELELKSIPSLVLNGYPERAGIYPAALRTIVRTMLERR